MKKNLTCCMICVFIITNIISFNVFAYNTGNDYPSEYQNHTYYSSYYGNYVAGKTPFGTGIADKWNFYTRECTSFVAWCLNSRNGVQFHNYFGGSRWGDAKNWG